MFHGEIHELNGGSFHVKLPEGKYPGMCFKGPRSFSHIRSFEFRFDLDGMFHVWISPCFHWDKNSVPGLDPSIFLYDVPSNCLLPSANLTVCY